MARSPKTAGIPQQCQEEAVFLRGSLEVHKDPVCSITHTFVSLVHVRDSTAKDSLLLYDSGDAVLRQVYGEASGMAGSMAQCNSRVFPAHSQVEVPAVSW